MAISPSPLCLVLLFTVSAWAGTVVYTNSGHPPVNMLPDSRVVWLDGPDRLLHQFLDPLPDDPLQAGRQARSVLQSANWEVHASQMALAYREIVHARDIGVEKVPAVVFGDRDVIYGTADVARATALRATRSPP